MAQRRASPTAAGEAGGAHPEYSNPAKPLSGKRGRRLGAGALLGHNLILDHQSIPRKKSRRATRHCKRRHKCPATSPIHTPLTNRSHALLRSAHDWESPCQRTRQALCAEKGLSRRTAPQMRCNGHPISNESRSPRDSPATPLLSLASVWDSFMVMSVLESMGVCSL